MHNQPATIVSSVNAKSGGRGVSRTFINNGTVWVVGTAGLDPINLSSSRKMTGQKVEGVRRTHRYRLKGAWHGRW